MERIDQPALNQAIEMMWSRFLPEMLERVSVLEVAEQAFQQGRLTQEQRNAANAAAHKLAGVLGTFGLTKGTILAREAETFFACEPDVRSDLAQELPQITSDLRHMIENRYALKSV